MVRPCSHLLHSLLVVRALTSRLYAHGRKEQAVQVLARLHSRDYDVHSPLILLEIQEIEANISITGADKRFWDFRALFRTAASRYRFGLCVIVSIWGQLSGNGLITCELIIAVLQYLSLLTVRIRNKHILSFLLLCG